MHQYRSDKELPGIRFLAPTERSPAELMLARHLARAVEDLLTVAPIELALTETMGVLLCRPRAS